MARARDEPVRLTQIYTRGGDAGETSLGDGSRVSKLDSRSSRSGRSTSSSRARRRARRGRRKGIRLVLERVQNELFDVGADLWCRSASTARLRVAQSQVDQLEERLRRFNAELPELRSFVLPGGTTAAAGLHVARTVCRRAERETLRRRAGARARSARRGLPEPAVRPALHPGARRERRCAGRTSRSGVPATRRSPASAPSSNALQVPGVR